MSYLAEYPEQIITENGDQYVRGSTRSFIEQLTDIPEEYPTQESIFILQGQIAILQKPKNRAVRLFIVHHPFPFSLYFISLHESCNKEAISL